MPSQRKDLKSTRQRRAKKPSFDASSEEPVRQFTEEELKVRAMIPALTPAHGLESTTTAILGSLSLGQQKPNSHTRKKSDGHVNRPPNAFIVFRRAQVQHMPPNITQHQQRISNLTAMFWRVLTAFEQKSWYNLADDIKALHAILFPEYNFSPRNASDTPKKPAIPHAGLTPERYDFAWNEAQVLIQKHSQMVDYVIDGPAPSGKLVRPKAPRKGQGTRAKERRQLEAAKRAAVEETQIDPFIAIASGSFPDTTFDDPQFYPVDDEPITNSSVEGETVQWSADFTLDGSVSSRSSPSWSEPVGPLDITYNEASFEQAPYVAEQQVAPDVQVASLPVHFNPVDPFSVGTHIQDDGIFSHNIQYDDTHTYVDPVMNPSQFMIAPMAMPKQDMSFMVAGHYTGLPTPGQVQPTYYNGAPVQLDVNVTYDFHNLEPTPTYLDAFVPEYNWQT